VRSRTSAEFRARLMQLPAHVRRQARQSYRFFREDPGHPSLRFKQVRREPAVYSARVGVAYRALAVRRGEDLVWFWIGHHEDYDSLLDAL